MENIHTITNNILQISVNKTGAELCGIKLLAGNKDYLWNASPEIWAGYAPVLFPIIGALKNDTYVHNGVNYSLPRHGFVRNNPAVELVSETDNSLTFRLQSSPDTLKQYPFIFEFLISYLIDENKITVNHEVKNYGEGKMLFSLGGHPAFKCPIDEGEQYAGYYIEFEQNETDSTYQIESSGLIGRPTDLILNNSRIIPLHYHLFDKGALVFKNLKSRKVRLISKKTGKRVEMNFDDFPYFGIWAKPGADYVCLEPWSGIADSIDTNQIFEKKEGIVQLLQGESFKASYSISVF